MATTSLAERRHLDTRELRALELYRTRGHEIRHVGQDLYLVPSCTGRGFYSVDYGDETCDCPDFEHRGENCKHILVVGIYHAKHRRSEASPHACTNGFVFVGFEDDNGVERVASYRCRRCSEAGR